MARILVVLGLWLAPSLAVGEDLRVRAEVLEVVDGDTLRVRARIWLGQDVETLVRVRGIDAPEIHNARCPAERALGKRARDFLRARAGKTIFLNNLAYDKFGGRVLADVADAAAHDLAAQLINKGFARVYQRGARASWCAPL